MNKKHYLFSLYLYYAVYFVAMGLTTFSGKYYGAIGLNNSQIGLISAVAAFVAIFAQPMWGLLSDRCAYKKNTIAGALVVAGLCALAVEWSGNRYLLLLGVLTLMNTFTLPAVAVGNAISIEYTSSVGKEFGPIRMTGTIGYQISILAAGFLLGEKLSGLYTAAGIALILAGLCATRMPPIRGYQHGNKKVPLTVFLKNRRILIMLGLVFLAEVCGQFYLAFFSKYLGDIGMSNSLTGIITTLSVAMEIPFLFLGDKLYKKMSIWKWMWIGLLINGLRFVTLSYVQNPVLITLTQLLSVFTLGCFEFFPAIYLSTAVDKELLGSAQNVYQTVAFGVSRIVGALLGGVLAEAIGIASVFRSGGIMLVLAAALTFVPLWKRMQEPDTK